MKETKGKLVIAGLILLVIFLGFSACKKSTDSTLNPDKAAIMALVAADDTSFSSEVFDTTTVSYPKIAVDTVKFWWRKIQQVSRTIDVTIYPPDSTHARTWALVTVTDLLSGRLMILGDSAGAHFIRSKPLSDQAVRKALFIKIGTDGDSHRGWRLIGVSDILIHSVPSTRVIESAHLVVRRAGVPVIDKTFLESDITEINTLDSILTLVKDDSVSLTVTTADASDSVFLHTFDCSFFGCLPHREDFENHHDNTFTISGVVGDELMEGMNMMRRHIAIDVLNHTSLDTFDGAYDSRIWGIHYRVKRTMMP